FPVEKVIQERPKLKKEIEDGLKVRLAPYWITVQAVSITNISFSRDFSHAIEQKQVEEQNVQRAEFVRQQAEKEGQRQLALAEGQAKANRLLQESLKSSPEVLQMKALDKWDGKLPVFIWGAAVFHLFGSNKENNPPMIKLIVGAGEVLVFLLRRGRSLSLSSHPCGMWVCCLLRYQALG